MRKITNLDIYAQVGANTAYDQTFTTTINDGTVTIDLLYTGVDSPKVNAIKIAKQTTPTCTTFTYSNWGACSGGNQSRTVTSSLPTGCSGGNPITTQTCTTQTCTAFTYSNWGTCTNGNQTRTVLTSTPSGCVGGNPVLTQTCTSTCTSFTYSNWNTCSNGTQSRTVTSSLPTGCSGGNPITTQTCTVSAGGLVAKYTFSGNMLDSSGNNHNGLCTGTGCPTLTTDKDSVANNAYDFSNNYINLGDLDLSGNFTLSFWMKPDTFPTTYASTIMKAYDYGCELNHGNTLTCYVGDNGYWTATTNITGLTANTWYYITLTYDGTTLKLYKNANLTNTDTGTHSTTDYALLIGSWNQSIEYFDGKMDEIKIYDKVLTQTEINQEYTITPTCTSFTYSNWGACSGGNQSRTVTSSIPSGCSGGNPVLTQTCTETCTSFTYSAWSTCTNGTQSRTVTSSLPNGCAGGNPITTQTCTTPTQGLIAQYTFSGNMQDSIGSNNGTCSGTRCPTLTTDKDNTANKAYEFSEDYIDLGDLDLDGNFTLSFWMKPNSFPSSGAYRSTVMKAYDYGCELNQGTKISCYVSNNGYSWSATASATGLVANNWYHVAMTYEGRTLKLYLNSVLKKTVTGRHTTQDSSLLVGSWRDEMEFFDGTLDEIRIYDRPLTQEEITALYQ